MYETYDHLAFRELMSDACGGPTLIILMSTIVRYNIILFRFNTLIWILWMKGQYTLRYK